MVATALATLVAWGAVRRVTDQVSPPPVLPLPTAVAIVDEGTAPPAEPTETQQRGGREEAGAEARKQRRRQREELQQSAAEATQPPVETQPADDPPPQPADEAEPPERTQSETITQSYDLVGGTVTVRYRDATTRLVQATPNSGFDLDVHDGGPGKVDVRFRSDRHESRLVARWDDGAPDPQTEERPR